MKRLLTGFILAGLTLTVIAPALAQEAEGVTTLESVIEASTETTTSTPEVATTTPLAFPSNEEASETTATEETEVATTSIELIIKFKENAADLDRASGRREADATIAEAGATLESHLIEANSAVVSVLSEEDARIAMHVLENDSAVEYAEPNLPRSFFAVASDDTLFPTQWGLNNTASISFNGTVAVADADIDAPEAWDLSLGTSTVVAVIDNGVLYTHPDLANTMWDGTACVSDTGTALGSCNHGYDFADNDTSPLPEATSTTDTYHGTHVAGIIAAELNNATGTVGVAPEAEIMALRFGLDVASEVRAIDFAIQNGAKIINASYGGETFSQAEYDAIARFRDAGGIFIAAAGNDGDDIDSAPLYPASYDLENIVTVAATDHTDGLAVFTGGASNYGDTAVDLAAPGRFIQSTIATGGTTADYGYLSGTSMAAPFVAGAAALLKSRYYATSTATSSVKAMKSALMNSGDTLPTLQGKTVSGKRLNAFSALNYLSSDLVAPVITLVGSPSVSLTVGNSYTDAGATALDDIDPYVSVVATSTVDTANVGTYEVTYTAQDVGGNQATPVVRTVTVSAAPVVDTPRRRSGGGGGGGGSSRSTGEDTNPARPLLSASVSPYASMTPEQRAALLKVLIELLTKLQAQLAALKAQGL